MKNDIILNIINQMTGELSDSQESKLKEVLIVNFKGIEVNYSNGNDKINYKDNNEKLLNLFISSKEIEGCSYRTIKYYKDIIGNVFYYFDRNIKNINTDDLREYLSDYKRNSNCSSVTIDNVRRVLSSFFSWLEDEDFIVKSPVRRIHKIKTIQPVKETFSDENIEKLRDNVTNIRDMAILDFLLSSGVRVGELINLNISDINFEQRSCVVLGKGNKQREVYFDAKTKIHLLEYLNSRDDNNVALFVSLKKPYKRLSISAVELIVRTLGEKSNVNKVYPHKFRRTLATMAIDKGMPIEQVQKLLGHVKIETTMHYAMVSQNNVKIGHRKYIC